MTWQVYRSCLLKALTMMKLDSSSVTPWLLRWLCLLHNNFKILRILDFQVNFSEKFDSFISNKERRKSKWWRIYWRTNRNLNLKYRVIMRKRKRKKRKNRRKTKRRRTRNRGKVESLNQGRVILVQVNRSHLQARQDLKEKEVQSDWRIIWTSMLEFMTMMAL